MEIDSAVRISQFTKCKLDCKLSILLNSDKTFKIYPYLFFFFEIVVSSTLDMDLVCWSTFDTKKCEKIKEIRVLSQPRPRKDPL